MTIFYRVDLQDQRGRPSDYIMLLSTNVQSPLRGHRAPAADLCDDEECRQAGGAGVTKWSPLQKKPRPSAVFLLCTLEGH